MRPEELKSDLASIVGEEYVNDSLYERRLYDHDIAPLPTEVGLVFKTVPDVVVKPSRVEDVAKVIKYANRVRVPVVPRGSSSWGYGGTIPTRGGIVLELTKLDGISDLDEEAMTVRVEAGVRWGKLLSYLEERGFTFGVYPSSAPSATVGGWIATGGLGIGSLKNGHLKENVTEIRLATPTGDSVSIREGDEGLMSFDTFFDSEGTLGVITEAILCIRPKPEKLVPVLASFDDLDSLSNVIRRVIDGPERPFFIEIQDRDYLELKRSIGIEAPEAVVLSLFIYEGSEEETSRGADHLRGVVDEFGGSLYTVESAAAEWEERFYYMRIKKAGPTLLAGEVTHSLSELGRVIEETRRIKERRGLRLGIKAFMVAPDTVLFMPMFLADEREMWKYMALLPVINEITKVGLNAGGRPYGFGIWNAFFVKEVYGGERTRELKERKIRLDPKDIMNPGKLYKVVTRFGVPLWGTLFRLFTSMLWILRYF